ncbi:MAG: hypothetical protein IJ716_02505 [Lachnospiraceae bacterium]|nr:hypothetical protein [Lachnospiraceae bacterium]
MDILLTMWIVIDMVFLLILPLRKDITKYQNKLRQRSIENVKSLGDKLMDILPQFFWLISMSLFIYTIIWLFPDVWIKKLLEWYKGIFIVALFPMFVTWIKEKNFNIQSVWNGCLFVSAALFSLVGYIIDTEDAKAFSECRITLNVLITIYITVFLAAMFEMRKESNKYYPKKLPSKGIRKDLYYRTPGLAVNVSDIELIKHCEKYFAEYMCRYREIKELRTIEYVNLAGVHRKLWYAKAACFMKIFVMVSIFIVVISLKFGMLNKLFAVIGLIIIFGVLLSIYKHIDLECLYKIGIRCIYDEWGYYLTCAGRSKFVGTVQMIEVSKFHKYVHSFLDIAALCRAVAFSDHMSKENRICIITRNLSELFTNYTEYEQKRNWVMVIPLWIAALFEFYVSGEISAEIKATVLKSADESVRADISIFLQSFWADMERKELKDGILDYIQSFETQLYT